MPGFLSPFGHRRSLLGHPVPAKGFRPSCDRPTGPHSPDPTGFPRSAHPRLGRIGRPLHPGASGALTADLASSVAACRLFQRPGPITPVHFPSPGAAHYETSTRVHSRSPARPSPRPVAPPDGTRALGLLPWASHPNRQDLRRTPGRGRASSTRPKLRVRRRRPPFPQAHSK